jgi:GxxExxY protein
MDENEVGRQILGRAIKVHVALGPGLLESTYEACLAHDLRKIGLSVERPLTLPLVYDGEVIETGYRIDLLVERLVVIEVKAVDLLLEVHRAQLLSYMKLGGYRLGYLLNFNVSLMKNGVTRLANGL